MSFSETIATTKLSCARCLNYAGEVFFIVFVELNGFFKDFLASKIIRNL